MANGLFKILGLGKFSSDLEISEAIVLSLGISFLHACIFASRSRIFVLIVSGSDFQTRVLASRILPFATPLEGNTSCANLLGKEKSQSKVLCYFSIYPQFHSVLRSLRVLIPNPEAQTLQQGWQKRGNFERGDHGRESARSPSCPSYIISAVSEIAILSEMALNQEAPTI